MTPYEPAISLSGEGPAVVLVPGMDGTGQLFYRQVPRLSQSHRVATYALRDDARDMRTLVTDLASVVDTAAPAAKRALIVGESFGGALGLSFALAHPDKVSGLVVLNSFPYFSPQIRLRLAIAGLTVLPWGAMQLVRRLTAFRLHSRHTHREDMAKFMRLTSGATRRGYLNRLHILRMYDVREALRGMDIPTLFVAADEDHLVPSVQQAELMASLTPRATVQVLAGHGHICLIAPGVDLAAVIVDWLAPSARGTGLPVQ